MILKNGPGRLIKKTIPTFNEEFHLDMGTMQPGCHKHNMRINFYSGK